MKLLTIINARSVLDELSNKEDINVHLAYLMAKFMSKTENEHKFYVTEASKIFDKYAIEEDDKKMVVPADKVELFKADLEKLNDTEAEDPQIRFKLSELSAELKMSMKQVYPLLDFICEEEQ